MDVHDLRILLAAYDNGSITASEVEGRITHKVLEQASLKLIAGEPVGTLSSWCGPDQPLVKADITLTVRILINEAEVQIERIG